MQAGVVGAGRDDEPAALSRSRKGDRLAAAATTAKQSQTDKTLRPAQNSCGTRVRCQPN